MVLVRIWTWLHMRRDFKQAIAARSMLSYARGRMLQCQTATRPSKLKIHRLSGFQYLVTEVKFNPVHPILATLHLNGKVWLYICTCLFVVMYFVLDRWECGTLYFSDHIAWETFIWYIYILLQSHLVDICSVISYKYCNSNAEQTNLYCCKLSTQVSNWRCFPHWDLDPNLIWAFLQLLCFQSLCHFPYFPFLILPFPFLILRFPPIFVLWVW